MSGTERPILILPTYSDSEKERKSGGIGRISRPTIERQQKRLAPKFEALTRLFQKRNAEKLSIRVSPDGLDPELALVFETVGSSANFMAAVKRIPELEWMVEYQVEGIEPDDDFHNEKDKDKKLTGKVYCVMSTQKALHQLLSYWRKYCQDPSINLGTGLASLKDVFATLKEIRAWSPVDRFEDTGVLEIWREELEVCRGTLIPFEIELFYRESPAARVLAEQTVRDLLSSMGGKVTSSCVLEEIGYHGLAAELPPERIQDLLSEGRDDIALANSDQIMFFRPTPQTMSEFLEESDGFDAEVCPEEAKVYSEPIVALLDGLPLENHSLLQGRILVDDPDGFAATYQAKDRIHGSAMASLIVHGDLNDDSAKSLDRVIYSRPIMRNKFRVEGFPDGVLLVDLIHRAVRRMFEGSDDNGPVAATVKVINLSIGDPRRQYLTSVSPLARLLDWLSWKYRVLFIISAGNLESIIVDNKEYSAGRTVEWRTQCIVNSVMRNNRNRKLFSPSECVNALTVGSCFADCSSNVRLTSEDYLIEDGLPNPFSAIGPGVARSIKPEILVPGGRSLACVPDPEGKIVWRYSSNEGPGCLTVLPRSNTPAIGQGYAVGTSVSAALTTHAAGHFYEVLDGVFHRNSFSGVPDEYAALLIKALLVHGASWQTLGRAIRYYGVTEQKAGRWFGYGVPDFTRVEQCTERRVTALGFGRLKNAKAHVFRLPFPVDLHSRRIKRKIVVTLAYFTPIAVNRQEYRKAQLWFTLGEDTKRLVPLRENTDWQSVARGTIQHEIFYGEKVIPWGEDDEIEIKVSCRQGTTTGAIGSEIDYAIIVSAETAEPVSDIYSAVAERIHGRVPISPGE